jgi:hypothetical protein
MVINVQIHRHCLMDFRRGGRCFMLLFQLRILEWISHFTLKHASARRPKITGTSSSIDNRELMVIRLGLTTSNNNFRLQSFHSRFSHTRQLSTEPFGRFSTLYELDGKTEFQRLLRHARCVILSAPSKCLLQRALSGFT